MAVGSRPGKSRVAGARYSVLARRHESGAGWRVLYTIDESAKLVTVPQIRHERRRYPHEIADEDAG
jgi:mRNA-degrading endonuclease RelE of RelBE toxin-antitoxin system